MGTHQVVGVPRFVQARDFSRLLLHGDEMTRVLFTTASGGLAGTRPHRWANRGKYLVDFYVNSICPFCCR